MRVLLFAVSLAITTYFASLTSLVMTARSKNAMLFWKLEQLSLDRDGTSRGEMKDFASIVLSRSSDPDLSLCAQYQLEFFNLRDELGADRLNSKDGDEVETLFFLVRNFLVHPDRLLRFFSLLRREEAHLAARTSCMEKYSSRKGNVLDLAISAAIAGSSFLLVHLIHGIRVRRRIPKGFGSTTSPSRRA